MSLFYFITQIVTLAEQSGKCVPSPDRMGNFELCLPLNDKACTETEGCMFRPEADLYSRCSTCDNYVDPMCEIDCPRSLSPPEMDSATGICTGSPGFESLNEHCASMNNKFMVLWKFNLRQIKYGRNVPISLVVSSGLNKRVLTRDARNVKLNMIGCVTLTVLKKLMLKPQYAFTLQDMRTWKISAMKSMILSSVVLSMDASVDLLRRRLIRDARHVITMLTQCAWLTARINCLKWTWFAPFEKWDLFYRLLSITKYYLLTSSFIATQIY